MSDDIRVRFAPSPTGPLHVGGLRTALFNYLFAKKRGGKIILRIEDTDKERFVDGSIRHIKDSLNWIGVKFDEEPFKQSERTSIYKKYIELLIGGGGAYYAFDSHEELEGHRKDHEEKGKTFIYNAHNRLKLKNSLTLTKEKTGELLKAGKYVVRFKMPDNEMIVFEDEIRGKIQVSSRELDDKILFKSDKMPTYHFANVVDDYLMKISHVIRGEEWLPSLPLHVLLYRAFGWKYPKFAHLPLILKPGGKGKLSKRDGEKFGFPVYALRWHGGPNRRRGEMYKKGVEGGEKPQLKTFMGFKEFGVLPQALNNYIAFLGWNPKTEKEIYSMKDLIREFSLKNINKAGGKFVIEKLKWINKKHIQQLSSTELWNTIIKLNFGKQENFWFRDHSRSSFSLDGSKSDIHFNHSVGFIEEFLGLFRHRLELLPTENRPGNGEGDIIEQYGYLFGWWDVAADKDLISKVVGDNERVFLKNYCSHIEKNFDSKSQLKEDVKAFSLGSIGASMKALRVCLVGKLAGPDLFDLMFFLEKEEVVRRIRSIIG